MAISSDDYIITDRQRRSYPLSNNAIALLESGYDCYSNSMPTYCLLVYNTSLFAVGLLCCICIIYYYPRRPRSLRWGFYLRLSVRLSVFPHNISKTDAATKFDVEMFQDESWKPVYFGVEMSKVKVTSQTLPAWVFALLYTCWLLLILFIHQLLY